MTHGWPLVPLGEVVTHRKEFISIDDTQEYRRCRVQLHAQGVILRDQLTGALIKTKEQQVCRAGEFLVAEIDAKVGGYGIVPDDLDGAIVSSHYFLFAIDSEKLDRRFLSYFVKTPAFGEQVTAKGTTNYAAIRPQDVLGYVIPLPPLPEQRRIVARIERLAAKIEEARGLRNDVTTNLDRLVVLMAQRHDLSEDEKQQQGWRWVNLGQTMREASSPVEVDATLNYPNLGVYSFGRGVFEKAPIRGTQTSATTLYQVHAGQFIYSRLFAFEGAYGMLGEQFDGYYVSGEFPAFDCDATQVLPEFLWAYFRSPQVWAELAAKSKGVGDRRQRIHVETILSHRLMLPPLKWQAYIRRTQAKADRLKALQARTATDLDALLPAILDRAFRGEL